jgi:hypothetical protein
MQDIRTLSIAVVLVLAPAFGCGDDAGGDGASPSGGTGTSGSGSQGEGEIDACAIVTQADASQLFGEEATSEAPFAPGALGACNWVYEVEDEIGSVSSQLLQFYIWPTEQYHSVPADSEPLDVGQDGYLEWSETLGVDTGWIQGGRALTLSYFSVGDGMPTHASRVEPMKQLASTVSDRL